MNEEELKKLVENGYSIADIAQSYNKGKSTIRFWLNKFNLVTTGKPIRKDSVYNVVDSDGNKKCSKCNIIKSSDEYYIITKRNKKQLSFMCKECSKLDVAERSLKGKDKFVKFMGGKCHKCNGIFHSNAYDFHHIEPEHKDFTISEKYLKNSEDIFKELEKCILLCANCHLQIHKEMKQETGYFNKIPGNTELWAKNRKRKIQFIGKECCQNCGYKECQEALAIVFPEHLKHFRKYNKTHWDTEFEDALKEASLICLNCHRQ